ncbi:MAG: hypothetical protein J3K34DRAFT_470655 [Monoraphidium minutum]|nr:MAG: hypothetical protein J3K34DRAFT_470655 [Monoraphidium minutum]
MGRLPAAPPASRRPAGPLALAALLAAAGGGGGLLLNGVADLAEYTLRAEVANAPIDDTTKALLLAAECTLLAAALVGAGRFLATALLRRLRPPARAHGLVAAGGAWLTTFVAARAALEM